jgi:hypothetical protein
MTQRLCLFVLISSAFLWSCGADHDGQSINACFSAVSANPCSSLNVGGSTKIITGQATKDIIAEQKVRTDFVKELKVTNIARDRAFAGVPPDSLSAECIKAWGENAIVIKTMEDWERFRGSCFFSVYSSEKGTSLPNIDFSGQMVIASMQSIDSLGTEIETVLEFGSGLTAVIRDDKSIIPPPAPGFPFHIVAVPKTDLPVDFIRVENLFSP